MELLLNENKTLLDQNGQLAQQGYDTTLSLKYSRKDVKGFKNRVKEWDEYIITSNNYGVILLLADLGYVSHVAASFIDFNNSEVITNNKVDLFTLGSLKAPASSLNTSWIFAENDLHIAFHNRDKQGKLFYFNRDFHKRGKEKKHLNIDLTYFNRNKNSIVITTAFPKAKTAFAYTQKINCLEVDGTVILGNTIFDFNRANNAMGVLNWNRGVWPYKSSWLWTSLSTYLEDGSRLGFNFGECSGIRNNATENIVFHNGVGHKIGDIKFQIPQDQNGNELLLKDQWHIYDNFGRVSLLFTPRFEYKYSKNALLLARNVNKVFGTYSGDLFLDDGTLIKIEDKLGFAEKAVNKW